MSNIDDFYEGIIIINENTYFVENIARALEITGNTELANDLYDTMLEIRSCVKIMKVAFNTQIVGYLDELFKIESTMKGE